MAERVLRGVPASPGIAAGRARLLDHPTDADAGRPLPLAKRGAEAESAARALAVAAQEVEELAERLRQDGRSEEAEIVDAGALMAADPSLRDAVREAVMSDGRSAAAAIAAATRDAAATLAELDDANLAARADDIRSIGRRAIRVALGGGPTPEPTKGWQDVVLVAPDLGPADVAEFGAGVSGIALAGGAVTAHAAIVARSLGLPMVVGLGDEVGTVGDGEPVVVDGSEGAAILSPSLARATQGRLATIARARTRDRAIAERELRAETLDGHRVVVLANVASAAEVVVALESGAEGVGLLRTELTFLDASAWPSEQQHHRALEPVLDGLRGQVATVRVLDFGGDKTPPFLAGAGQRGIELLLQAPEALEAQLSAIVRAGRGTQLRVLLPMVGRSDQVRRARDALERAVERVPDAVPPLLGAMIETAEAAGQAEAIATEADFLSIGTNDLTASVLGRDRFAPGELVAHDPRVLERIAVTVRAAHDAAKPVEVCGEAASDPHTAPLLIGLGVDELSVGAARVGTTRAWVRTLRLADLQRLGRRALEATSATDVTSLTAELARSLDLAERGDAADQSVNGVGRVVPVRRQA
jgi:phosphoenolpyruvate-protein phosphotransferase